MSIGDLHDNRSPISGFFSLGDLETHGDQSSNRIDLVDSGSQVDLRRNRRGGIGGLGRSLWESAKSLNQPLSIVVARWHLQRFQSQM